MWIATAVVLALIIAFITAGRTAFQDSCGACYLYVIIACLLMSIAVDRRWFCQGVHKAHLVDVLFDPVEQFWSDQYHLRYCGRKRWYGLIATVG
jgi:hypothetical protein